MKTKSKIIVLVTVILLCTVTVAILIFCNVKKGGNTQKKTYDMSGVVFEDLTIEYDGQPHSIIATNLPAGVTVDYENNSKTEVGTYTVIAHFYGDSANYEHITDKATTLTIVQDEIYNFEFTREENIDGYSVTGYKGRSSKLVIPATYNNLPVTSIGEKAFYDCFFIESIEIPDSVTYIGSYAFKYCTSLKSVHIPSSVEIIDSNVFNYCTSLESIKIPDSVKIIGNNTFGSCTKLTSVVFGEDSQLTSIGSQAFRNCIKLENITIPQEVINIGTIAFFGCTKLTYVNFKSINGWAVTERDFDISTSISSSALADASTAARYLTEVYCSMFYKWTRS